jgi:hypothetical protein
MPESDTHYLDRTPDELDLELGRLLLADQLGSKPMSDTEAIATARRWLTTNLARLRGGVCGSPFVQQQLLAKPAQNRNELFAAVVDAVAKLAGFGSVPATLLAARLVHYGLGRLCGEAESTSKEAT